MYWHTGNFVCLNEKNSHGSEKCNFKMASSNFKSLHLLYNSSLKIRQA